MAQNNLVNIGVGEFDGTARTAPSKPAGNSASRRSSKIMRHKDGHDLYPNTVANASAPALLARGSELQVYGKGYRHMLWESDT